MIPTKNTKETTEEKNNTTPTTATNQQFKIRDNEGRTEIWDPVRLRYVALTPEEWVRQNIIHYLHHSLGYPLEIMQVEGSITLNKTTRRCDIVIYNKELKPVMIVECKQSNVPINQKVADQACQYNAALNVPYLLLSNGIKTLCLQVDKKECKLKQIDKIPTYNEIR